jgi:hypothetical protein
MVVASVGVGQTESAYTLVASLKYCYSAASRIVADENASALQSKGVVHAVSPKAFQQVQAQGSPSATFEQDIQESKHSHNQLAPLW